MVSHKFFVPHKMRPIHTIDDTIFDFQFHPYNSILCTSTIEGQVSLFSYTPFSESATTKVHTESIRSIEFSNDGGWIYTASLDHSFTIIDSTTLHPLVKKSKAHKAGLSIIKPINEYLFATGDDNGVLKLWDLRTKKVARKYEESHLDYISDLVIQNDLLITTGGDGLLCVHDPKAKKPVSISDNQDDELLTCQVVKNGRKIVVGTQEGIVLLFNWNDWQDCSDRFKGHPSSVTQLVKVNENELLSGCADGAVRRIGILPNQLLENVCSVGKGKDVSGDGIERLRVSHDGLLGISTMDGLSIFQPKPQDLFEKSYSSASSEDNDEFDDPLESDGAESQSSDSESDDDRKPSTKKPKLAFKTQLSFEGLD